MKTTKRALIKHTLIGLVVAGILAVTSLTATKYVRALFTPGFPSTTCHPEPGYECKSALEPILKMILPE